MLKPAFAFTFVLSLSLPFLQHTAHAQTTEHTWNGVSGPEDPTYDGSDPYPGYSWIWHEALSGDGRFVTFWSSKTNLVPGDANAVTDAFVRDRVTLQTEIVSIASDGAPANNASSHPTISANGRHVAFRSCATNLVAGDTNGRCDVFVRDRLLGTTTRINVGPIGEEAKDDESFFFSLSANGRFVAFIATFTSPYSDRHVWLRDRDTDGNGVFDEAGAVETIEISSATVGNASLGNAVSVTISGNGRFIAYTANAVQDGMGGDMLFAHDRETGMTMRIDVPTASLPDLPGYSYWPDLDNEGRYLVYTSDAPNLVDDDGDTVSDLFVFNLQTGGNVRIRPFQADAPSLQGWWTPSISDDGRYVAFLGMADIGGAFVYKSFGIDRQTGLSYEISGNADGTPDTNGNGGVTSISADGSSIAFAGSWSVVNDPPPTGLIFVAIDLTLSPSSVDIPAIGGSVTIDISAPADTPWMVHGFWPQTIEALGSTSGIGSGFVMATVFANNSEMDRDLFLYIGSERVRIHQLAVPIVSWVMPPFGPITGGTVVQVVGQGFAQGASVLIGGAPATDVTVVDSTTIQATTAAQTTAGAADVLVMNFDGSVGWLEGGFYYKDNTPPVVIPTLNGTLGNDGWYTSDVVLMWIVSDPQSEASHDCQPVTYSFDSPFHMGGCTAQSAGGTTFEQVQFKRDATPPLIAMATPGPGSVFARGEQVVPVYSCDDPNGGSGIAQCSGPVQPGATLDTSHAGSFSFTVTARDVAGNQSTAVTSYAVARSVPALVWPTPAAMTYGGPLGPAQLNASADVAGTFTYSPALGTILPAGTHTLSVTFVPNDAANYESASASVSVTVQKATPVIFWSAPGNVTYGTPLGAAQLNATAPVAGTFSYGPAAGAVLGAATHMLSVVFMPADSANYDASNASVALTVTPAPLSVRANDTSKVYGEALPAFTATATGFVAGDTMSSLTGVLSFATPATATSAPGSYPVSPSGVSSPNYAIALVSGTLTIAKASTSASLLTTPNPSAPQKPVQLTATVAAVAPGLGTPSGSVQFSDNGTVIGTATLVNGVATMTKNFKKGTHPLTATYVGNENFTGSSGTRLQQVN